MNLEKEIVAPIAVMLISWFVKDYVFSLWQKRQEMLRTEWKQRLVEVWSPLFYWSGSILFDSGKTGWERHGVKELESLLSKNAYLIPPEHYHTLIKLIEWSTTLPDRQLEMKEIGNTRNYIYKQIELLNYVLFKKDLMFDPGKHIALWGSQQGLLRILSQIVIHTAVWIIFGIYFYSIYWCLYNEHTLLTVLLIVPMFLVVLHDLRKRIELDRDAKNM